MRILLVALTIAEKNDHEIAPYDPYNSRKQMKMKH
jgi:hypothetical protein